MVTDEKAEALTWTSTCKKTKLVANNKIVELPEDRGLFARMMMVCQSWPEINIQEAIGLRTRVFSGNEGIFRYGTMLHCSNKSVLMDLIEKEAP